MPTTYAIISAATLAVLRTVDFRQALPEGSYVTRETSDLNGKDFLVPVEELLDPISASETRDPPAPVVYDATTNRATRHHAARPLTEVELHGVSPQRVTKIQIKRRFLVLERWDEFKAIRDAAGNEKISEDWGLVPSVEIGSAFAIAVAATMQLDINEFFREASRL